ncbi:MAG: DUF4860 domain-containing protein [Defluviitaleaceae bacterium]|nr:DUF4860 domain-containing protein [Defluviitaleaceae bacterium]
MSRNRVDTVFVLLVFCVFAISVFMVIMHAGSTYSDIIEVSTEGSDERIALSYVRTKIRANDRADEVSVGYFDGINALRFEENFGGQSFVTLIYLYDGWVHELFHFGFMEFNPSDGMPMVRAESLYFSYVAEGLIRVATDYGSILIHPRSSVTEGGAG